MKLVNMSLMAALLLGSSAYAIDNVKVSGDAKLFYGTQAESLNGDPEIDIFNKDASYADAGLRLAVTADLKEGLSAGVTAQAVSTLGLENSLVSGVWSGSHSTTPDGSSLGMSVDDALWISEAWIEGKAGNTTGKIGRQTLETPLVFTETWSVDYNTFEAALITNTDLPDTTLIGAYIGKSNGFSDDSNTSANIGSVTSVDGKFNTFAKNGAYAIGAINNSFAPLTAQAWYYQMPSLASAYWLQADLDMDGVLAGVQYTDISYSATGDKDDTAYAVMLGYDMKDVVTLKAAYSSVDDEGTNGVANIATNGQNAGAASSLYTEMWWWFATVSGTGADSYSLSAETTVADVDLFLGLYSSDIEVKGSGVKDEVDEIALTASKSFGDLDTSVALIHDMFDTNAAKGTDYMEDLTTFQIYLTYNF